MFIIIFDYCFFLRPQAIAYNVWCMASVVAFAETGLYTLLSTIKSKKSGGFCIVAKGIAFSAILFAVMVRVVENYKFYYLLLA